MIDILYNNDNFTQKSNFLSGETIEHPNNKNIYFIKSSNIYCGSMIRISFFEQENEYKYLEFFSILKNTNHSKFNQNQKSLIFDKDSKFNYFFIIKYL